MAVGLEARVPLLGTELLDVSERMCDWQKIGLHGGKRVLREIARRRLPTYITRRHKRGFAVPLADLFAGPWRAEATAWLADAPSSVADGRLASASLRKGRLAAADAWALSALIGWEHSVIEAKRESRANDLRFRSLGHRDRDGAP